MGHARKETARNSCRMWPWPSRSVPFGLILPADEPEIRFPALVHENRSERTQPTPGGGGDEVEMEERAVRCHGG